MSQYLFKTEQRIEQLERELAECKEDKHAALFSAHCRQEALAAIVKQMREALHNGAFPGDNSVLTLHKWVQEALAIDISKAEAILRQRDAEVLRDAANKLNRIMGGDGLWQHEVEDELRRMADELLKP